MPPGRSSNFAREVAELVAILKDGDISGANAAGYLGTLKGSWKLHKIHPEFLPKVYTDTNLVVDPVANSSTGRNASTLISRERDSGGKLGKSGSEPGAVLCSALAAMRCLLGCACSIWKQPQVGRVMIRGH